jgi:hypothetical protein
LPSSVVQKNSLIKKYFQFHTSTLAIILEAKIDINPSFKVAGMEKVQKGFDKIRVNIFTDFALDISDPCSSCSGKDPILFLSV